MIWSILVFAALGAFVVHHLHRGDGHPRSMVLGAVVGAIVGLILPVLLNLVLHLVLIVAIVLVIILAGAALWRLLGAH